MLRAGAARANAVAERTLADVYDRVGFLPAPVYVARTGAGRSSGGQADSR
jgi:hypothetical protein